MIAHVDDSAVDRELFAARCKLAGFLTYQFSSLREASDFIRLTGDDAKDLCSCFVIDWFMPKSHEDHREELVSQLESIGIPYCFYSGAPEIATESKHNCRVFCKLEDTAGDSGLWKWIMGHYPMLDQSNM